MIHIKFDYTLYRSRTFIVKDVNKGGLRCPIDSVYEGRFYRAVEELWFDYNIYFLFHIYLDRCH